MLDPETLRLLDEMKRDHPDHVIDISSLGAMIIPWGSDCCHGCELYQSGISITAHGVCPIQQRRVSPHYFCEEYEQD
jgi:hypothetical protein